MKIVISGDSFTFGQGCSDKPTVYDPKTKCWMPEHDIVKPSEYCWGSLLQKQYPNSTVYNFAQPGRDNIYISTTIIDNIKDADLVIFPATSFNRMQANNPNTGGADAWIVGNPVTDYYPDYTNAAKMFAKHLYNENYLAEISTMAVLAVYAECLVRQIPFIWSCSPYGISPIIEKSRTYQNFARRTSIIEQHKFHPLFGYWQTVYYEPKDVPSVEDNPWLHNDGHANDRGHQYYFEHVVLPKVKQYLG